MPHAPTRTLQAAKASSASTTPHVHTHLHDVALHSFLLVVAAALGHTGEHEAAVHRAGLHRQHLRLVGWEGWEGRGWTAHQSGGLNVTRRAGRLDARKGQVGGRHGGDPTPHCSQQLIMVQHVATAMQLKQAAATSCGNRGPPCECSQASGRAAGPGRAGCCPRPRCRLALQHRWQGGTASMSTMRMPNRVLPCLVNSPRH